jgi:glycosyltransferase involved in cell wall biosynthesis
MQEQPSLDGILVMADPSWVAGIVYLQNLTGGLEALGEQRRVKPLLLSSGKNTSFVHEELSRQPFASLPFAKVRQPSPWKRLQSLLRGQAPACSGVSLEQLLQKHRIRSLFPVMHPMRLRGNTRQITWIPDFQHHHFPDLFSSEERESRTRRFNCLIQTGHRLVVSSQDAKADCLRFYDADANRVTVMPFCTALSPDCFNGDPQSLLKQMKLPERFLVFPAQFWKHKNHENLFRAMGKLKRSGKSVPSLVCTGKAEDYRNPDHAPRMLALLEKEGILDEVHLTGVIPRKPQIQLLRASLGIVQPSLFEGWSALVEDARALGKPIALSDIPVHREQKPPRSRFFDPMDVDAIAESLLWLWNLQPEDPDPQTLLEINQRSLIHFARQYEALVLEC